MGKGIPIVIPQDLQAKLFHNSFSNQKQGQIQDFHLGGWGVCKRFCACTHITQHKAQSPLWLGSEAHLTLKRLGEVAMMAPPSTFRAITRQRAKLSPRHFYDNFLSSFPHILTPNLWRPGVRFRSYVTFCTYMLDRKWLQNVILCTKSMQIEFFTSYKYTYFYSQWLKLICFSIRQKKKIVMLPSPDQNLKIGSVGRSIFFFFFFFFTYRERVFFFQYFF